MAIRTVNPGQSIQSAADASMPGDVVLLAAGVHTGTVGFWTRPGTAAAPITLRGAPGAVMQPAGGYNAVTITMNYTTVEDLEIRNAAGDGIEANGAHHITVRRCKITGCGESGFQTNYCDWVTAEDNECAGNALLGWFSGISLYQNRNLFAGSETRNFIRNNRCYDNVTPASGFSHTDGNGIIIDDFRSTQTAGFPSYDFLTLVENNLCYGNGGKGIQVTWSDGVTVRRNTCVANNVDPLNGGTWRGDISISDSRRAVVDGNIAVCVRGAGFLSANRAYDNTGPSSRLNNTVFTGNIGWDEAGTPSVRTDSGNATPVVAWIDPQLVNYLPTTPAAADAGWRPATTEPEPDIMELAALVAALEAYAASLETRLAALEARPTDPEIAARVATVEAEIVTLKAFDQAVKDL